MPTNHEQSRPPTAPAMVIPEEVVGIATEGAVSVTAQPVWSFSLSRSRAAHPSQATVLHIHRDHESQRQSSVVGEAVGFDQHKAKNRERYVVGAVGFIFLLAIARAIAFSVGVTTNRNAPSTGSTNLIPPSPAPRKSLPPVGPPSPAPQESLPPVGRTTSLPTTLASAPPSFAGDVFCPNLGMEHVFATSEPLITHSALFASLAGSLLVVLVVEHPSSHRPLITTTQTLSVSNSYAVVDRQIQPIPADRVEKIALSETAMALAIAVDGYDNDGLPDEGENITDNGALLLYRYDSSSRTRWQLEHTHAIYGGRVADVALSYDGSVVVFLVGPGPCDHHNSTSWQIHQYIREEARAVTIVPWNSTTWEQTMELSSETELALSPGGERLCWSFASVSVQCVDWQGSQWIPAGRELIFGQGGGVDFLFLSNSSAIDSVFIGSIHHPSPEVLSWDRDKDDWGEAVVLEPPPRFSTTPPWMSMHMARYAGTVALMQENDAWVRVHWRNESGYRFAWDLNPARASDGSFHSLLFESYGRFLLLVSSSEAIVVEVTCD